MSKSSTSTITTSSPSATTTATEKTVTAEAHGTTEVNGGKDTSSTSSSPSSSNESQEVIAALVPPDKKKEESGIMDVLKTFRSLALNCTSIFSPWLGNNRTTSEETTQDVPTETEEISNLPKTNPRKRRRASHSEDEGQRPPNGAAASKPVSTRPKSPPRSIDASSTTTSFKSSPEQMPTPNTTTTTTVDISPSRTEEPRGSLVAFAESKWREQSHTPGTGVLKSASAPSGKDQLARSLARRSKATQVKDNSSIFRLSSSYGGSQRVRKRSATPMSMMSVSMMSASGTRSTRRGASTTPFRNLGNNPWPDPTQYNPPSTKLIPGNSVSTFRSSWSSSRNGTGTGVFLTPRSKRLEQNFKEFAEKRKPWLENDAPSSDNYFDGESLSMYIKHLQAHKVDGFENYTHMTERQKLISEQIQQLRAPKPSLETLREISDKSLRNLHDFLASKNQDKEARLLGGCRITPKNLHTLSGSQWLNDEVINGYIHLVKERANQGGKLRVTSLNSTFITSLKDKGYKGVARWAKRAGAGGEALLDLHGVIIPIHRNFHWTLAFVNVKQKRFEYYDSLAGHWDPISMLREYMKNEVGARYEDSEWEGFYPGDATPQQGNGVDCGVFLCKTAEVIVRGGVISFSQKDIPRIRRMMQVELFMGDLAAV